MKRCAHNRAKHFVTTGALGALLFTQGCIATRDWVKEQMDPLSTRVSQGEERLTKAEGQIGTLDNRMGGVEGKLGQYEGRLGSSKVGSVKWMRKPTKLSIPWPI